MDGADGLCRFCSGLSGSWLAAILIGSNKVLKKGDPTSRIHVAGYVLHQLVARRILETIK